MPVRLHEVVVQCMSEIDLTQLTILSRCWSWLAIAALSKAAKSGKGHHSGNELWKTALDLLDRMKHDGIEPDGFSYSSAISCCGAYGKWEEALRLFEQMKAGGPRTQPNSKF